MSHVHAPRVGSLPILVQTRDWQDPRVKAMKAKTDHAEVSLRDSTWTGQPFFTTTDATFCGLSLFSFSAKRVLARPLPQLGQLNFGSADMKRLWFILCYSQWSSRGLAGQSDSPVDPDAVPSYFASALPCSAFTLLQCSRYSQLESTRSPQCGNHLTL